MSAHYSKYLLNTYAATPYFQAQMPKDYPLYKVLRKSKTFHNLPPQLKNLAALAKEWAIRNTEPPSPAGWIGIEKWYDKQGYELDPATGQRLSASEIAAQWKPEPELDDFIVEDITVPHTGFPDPTTWKESKEASSPGERPSEKQLLRDLTVRGSKATARTYGLEVEEPEVDEDIGRAQNQFTLRADKVLKSKYFTSNMDQYKALLEAISNVDLYDQLDDSSKEVFNRAEVYEKWLGGSK